MFGSRSDRVGAEISGIPRRINRQKLDCTVLAAELNDPSSLRARVLAGQRGLLRIRHQHHAFAPSSEQRVLGFDSRVFALLRQSHDGTDTVLCLQNVSPECVVLQLDRISAGAQDWKPLWGSNCDSVKKGSLVLESWGSAWLAAVFLHF
jgi:glucosylglycerate phosphorylase